MNKQVLRILETPNSQVTVCPPTKYTNSMKVIFGATHPFTKRAATNLAGR